MATNADPDQTVSYLGVLFSLNFMLIFLRIEQIFLSHFFFKKKKNILFKIGK